MRNIARAIAVFTILVTVQSCMVDAAPMRAPTLEEAVRTPLVVIAKYRDYKPIEKIEYFSPPVARYDLVKPLRGSLASSSLSVSYAFHDGSACLPLQGWKFEKSRMPRPGSSWILFLDSVNSGIYYTYGGDYGRMQAGPDNLKKVESMIKSMPALQIRKLIVH